jgi:hypothetical protein
LDLWGNTLTCSLDGLFQMQGMAQINLHDLALACMLRTEVFLEIPSSMWM